MDTEFYKKALRLGQKEYKAAVAQGRSGLLPIMPERLENGTLNRETLEMVEIPMALIAGTCTEGRSNAFSEGFYPLMEENTEFAVKWGNLCHEHLTEGLRDPIKTVEYMGKFYVLEGHKRVSVFKYFGAASVTGIVIRLYPEQSEDREFQIYQEFLSFYRATKMYLVHFSHLGRYTELLQLVGAPTPWNNEQICEFRSFYNIFSAAFQAKFGHMEEVSEALIAYLRIFDYAQCKDKLPATIEKEIEKIRPELTNHIEQSGTTLLLHTDGKKSLFSGLRSNSICAAFLYPRSPENHVWSLAHETGRRYIQATMPKQVKTTTYEDIKTEAQAITAMEDAIAKGAELIFVSAAEMVRACVQVAAEYPDIKILNCSLNSTHPMIRTYYLRLYESKFLSGALAGVLTKKDTILYFCTHMREDTIANINAFARGVQMTNPYAKVILCCQEQGEAEQDLPDGIFYIDNFDVSPRSLYMPHSMGLYENQCGKIQNLVIVFCRWGKFYQKIVYRILHGTWKGDAKSNKDAVNYWWGLKEHVIEMIYAPHVPDGVKQLMELLQQSVKEERIGIFCGNLYDQQGLLRYDHDMHMNPQQILSIDWLLENVVGDIPQITTKGIHI